MEETVNEEGKDELKEVGERRSVGRDDFVEVGKGGRG